MNTKIVMHKKTGELKEMTESFLGQVIWLVDYDKIPSNKIACFPYVIYDDNIMFNDYETLGDL